MKILIVEDDPISQEMYTDLLLEENYQVITASTGEEALKRIERNLPHLILLDLAIPGINGRALLGEFKRIAKKIPIIIISGKVGMRDDPEIKLSTQVRNFLTKPVSPKELLITIRQILFDTKKTQPKQERKPKVGNYQLGDCIGQGGMGMVFRGKLDGQTVAIKILSKNLLQSEETVARFNREAKLLARVVHPNVIKCLDMGPSEDGLYMAMEYFPARGLDQILAQVGYFSLREGIDIIRQVAEGMQAAHSLGLIHRDLKPSNILYEKTSKIAKVVDFGLAREIRPDEQITVEKIALGTPFYMSPEQCMAEEIDSRSDIYNLGITFYHILTGMVPFHEGTIHNTMIAQITKPIQWPTVPKIHTYIQEVIEKMVQKERENRYASMIEISNTLSIFLK